MDLADVIRNLSAENLSQDKFVVDVQIFGRKIPKRVLIIIDGDRGITIDDCANLSRALSKQFDQRALFGEDNYLLEVSTPGLDHPLMLKRQFYKNKGRRLKVVTKDGTTEGRLLEVTDDKIALLLETGAGKNMALSETDISFSDIEKAFVLVSFK